MADLIRVDTDLLEKCANELTTAAQGFGDAASILSGLNTSEEWWSKMGRLSPLKLQDEGSSMDLGDAGAAVRALAAVMRRYDSRATTLGKNVSKAAGLFSNTEKALLGRANGQDEGETREVAQVEAVVAQASAEASNADQKAREKRKKHSKWLKFGAGVLCTVGSIAVVIGTGGAALPVIVAGVTAGAVTAGVNNAADQYAEKGWDDIDWSSAGKDAFIGGIVGGVTSTISIGGSAVGQQIANRVTGQVTSYTTNAAGRLIVHTVSGATTSVATGMASRAGGEAVSEYLNEGSVNWDRVRDRAFDRSQIASDGLIGGTIGYMQGQRFNKAVAANEAQGQYIRKDSYRNNNPYSQDYGNVDWKTHAPGDGMVPGSATHNYEIPKGAELKRSGSEYGGYLRNSTDSFDSASLPYMHNTSIDHQYEVLKPIPNTTKSTAAPAFDMPGGATQYQLPKGTNVLDLLRQGYLRRIY